MECECLDSYLKRLGYIMNLSIQRQCMDLERNSIAVKHRCVYVRSVLTRFLTCIS